MTESIFDGITFHSDSDLINFLKQSYFANKSTIKAIETDRNHFMSRLQDVEKAAREYEAVTTYARDEEDLEVCAYCETGLGTPHRKDCRASVAHKNLLRVLRVKLDIHF